MNKINKQKLVIWLSLASFYFILALVTLTDFKLFALYMSFGVITLNFAFFASLFMKE